MIESLRGRARGAAFVTRVLRQTRLFAGVRPRGVARFLQAARGSGIGPHLAIMFHAHTQPDKECIVDGDRRISWGELDALINQLCHALVARGARSGAGVGLMLPNGADTLIAQQALVRIGAVAVQIGYRLKAGEVAYILDNAEPAVILCHADHQDVIAEARAHAGAQAPVLVLGAHRGLPAGFERWEDATAGQPTDRPPSRDAGGSMGGGVIVYTSGTTGKPKGATRTFKQTGLEAVGDLMLQVGMSQDDRHLVLCPLYHSAAPAFVAIMFSLGGTCVLPGHAAHFDPEETLALIERERITSTLVVPTMLVRITALPAEVRRRYDTSSLRWIMSAAAPLATETARQVQEQFGPVLWNFYGSTETGIVTLAGPGDHLARPGTIGRLLRGNLVRVLGDDGAALPPGEVGELYARNSMLIAGYHKNPDATQASIRDGYFSVGDLARADADGYYYLESRKHDMVISGGVNIYPREIEDHLHTHPAVLEAAVVGVADPEWGESLRAFVVVRPGQRLAEHEIIEFCRGGLADYKRPRSVVFLDELPRNPTGKVLKRELRGRA